MFFPNRFSNANTFQHSKRPLLLPVMSTRLPDICSNADGVTSQCVPISVILDCLLLETFPTQESKNGHRCLYVCRFTPELWSPWQTAHCCAGKLRISAIYWEQQCSMPIMLCVKIAFSRNFSFTPMHCWRTCCTRGAGAVH